MIRTRVFALAALAALSLSACGTSQTDRGLSGAGIGAATGAVIGGVTGGSIGTGAVIGGVVGKPIWKKSCRQRQREGANISCPRKHRK
jgi:hypothetical protein